MLSQQNVNIFSKIFWKIFPIFRKVNFQRLKLNLEIHVKNIVMSKYPNIKRKSLIIAWKETILSSWNTILYTRGVVIMDKIKYTEKVLTILLTKQFQKLKLDHTKSTEQKSQLNAWQEKSNLNLQFKSMKYCILVLPVQESFMVQQSYIELIQKY